MPPTQPHMVRARAADPAMGGAERTNVFARIQLALFGQVPWRATPVMPVEIMHLPRWFFFHLSKVSYWSRTVMVPLLVLMALRPRARNPRGMSIAELFRTPPEQVRDWIRGPYRSAWGIVFKTLDTVLRPLVPFFPAGPQARDGRGRGVRGRAAERRGRAGRHLPGDGQQRDDVRRAGLRARTTRMRRPPGARCASCWCCRQDRAYCQPCLSPIWDTGLAGHAVAEAEGGRSPPLEAACEWLAARQVTTVRGDWAGLAPGRRAGRLGVPVRERPLPGRGRHRGGGHAAAPRRRPGHDEAIERARDWILGMQSRNGGWGAFDADNDYQFLNHIPFADHGALLDPPTVDVTARCLSFLAQIGHGRQEPAVARALAYLRREQEADGSWFGRWGTNYIYGTWSALCALNAAGLPHADPAIRRGGDWLLARQRADGGWGEDEESYADAPPAGTRRARRRRPPGPCSG